MASDPLAPVKSGFKLFTHKVPADHAKADSRDSRSGRLVAEHEIGPSQGAYKDMPDGQVRDTRKWVSFKSNVNTLPCKKLVKKPLLTGSIL